MLNNVYAVYSNTDKIEGNGFPILDSLFHKKSDAVDYMNKQNGVGWSVRKLKVYMTLNERESE